MPLISQRYKSGNYIKIDKEKENNELKKRLRPVSKGKPFISNVYAKVDFLKRNFFVDIQSSYAYGHNRGKQLNTYLEKSPQSKIPPAWERLSKLKRVSSNNVPSQLKPCRSQHNLMEKGNTRPTVSLVNARATEPPQVNFNRSAVPVPVPLPVTVPVPVPVPVPITPCPSVCSHGYSLIKKSPPNKSIILPDVEKKDLEINCDGTIKSVKISNKISEINSVKPLVNEVKTEVCGSPKLNLRSPKYYTARKSPHVTNDMSDDSLDEYMSASNILITDQETNPNTEIGEYAIINNVKHILQCKERSIKPEEWTILNKMIKMDKRSRNLNKDSSQLFKEILRSQLDDVVRSQVVLKSVLKKLNAVDRGVVNSSAQTDQMVLNNQTSDPSTDVPRKLEVDVVFKNIPTLEKELILLRAIGQKLESGLKNSAQNCEPIFSSCPFDTYSIVPRNMNMLSACSVEDIGDKYEGESILKHLAFEIKETISVANCAVSLHVLNLKGVAREFCIAYKTINELKESANQPFYISDSEGGNLRQTSFIKLKSNPDELMRHIKSKNPYVSFNLLDHDPIFFKNIFYHKAARSTMGAVREDSSLWGLPVKQSLSIIDKCQEDRLPLNICDMNGLAKQTSLLEENISMTIKNTANLATDSRAKTIDSLTLVNEKAVVKKNPLETKATSKDEATKSKSERRLEKRNGETKMVRRSVKNVKSGKLNISTVRTVLVGIVQVFLFFILIVVFTLPDVSCKLSK